MKLADAIRIVTPRDRVTVEFKYQDPKSGETETHELEFHPLRLPSLFLFKQLGTDLAKALSVVFNKRDTDTEITEKQIEDPEGGKIREWHRGASAAGVVAQRMQHEERVWSSLVERLGSDQTRFLVGSLIKDSLRIEDADPDKIVDEFPVTALPQIMDGLFRANREALAPFEKKIRAISVQAIDRLQGAVDQPLDSSPEESPAAEAPSEPE